MKTVNDLIEELQALKPSLRELPVKVIAENGLHFEAVAKQQPNDSHPTEIMYMVITYD